MILVLWSIITTGICHSSSAHSTVIIIGLHMVLIAQAAVYTYRHLAIYILLDKSAVCKADGASLGLEAH